jgi:hypothetical protein
MGPAMKFTGRMLAIAVAAVLFVGLTELCAGWIHPRPPVRFGRFRERRRRAPWPHPFGVVRFAEEGVLIGLVTLAGRKVLRLRL